MPVLRLDVRNPSKPSQNWRGGRSEGSTLVVEVTEWYQGTVEASLESLASSLRREGVNWLEPLCQADHNWVLRLDELRASAPPQFAYRWMRGAVLVRPGCSTTPGTGGVQFVARFATSSTEVVQSGALGQPDLSPFIERFLAEHREPQRCGLVIMRFDDTRAHRAVLEAVRATCGQRGLSILRADDHRFSEDLLTNVRTYMHCCAFGVAVMERISAQEHNPNVALEIGYMLALGKPVCLLKDRTLTALQSDLVGRLVNEFDVQDPAGSVSATLDSWLVEKRLA